MQRPPMLAAGEHPVALVLEGLKQLSQNERYCLIAPFYPASLIDKASSLGASFYVEQKDNESYHVYFTMP